MSEERGKQAPEDQEPGDQEPEDQELDLEIDLEELEEEEKPAVPDKPTGIAPGDVEYPGKGAPPAGAKGGAPVHQAQRGGKTGPKGADYKSANQS